MVQTSPIRKHAFRLVNSALAVLQLAHMTSQPVWAADAAQVPLGSGRTCTQHFCADAVERDAFLIFNELHGLLRQWDNTLAPNGFSYTLASVPANTILYHSRLDEYDPPSPEWFSFQYEMGYGIFGTRDTPAFLRTYRSTRELANILYIDGMSAALTDMGTLDSQDALIYGTVREGHYEHEYERAIQLCKWADQVGVKGFVRQNVGFELLWCDWSEGVELILTQNSTEWTDPIDRENLPVKVADYGNSLRRSGVDSPPPVDPDGKHPELDLPPFGDYPSRGTDLSNYAFWAWFRSAPRVYGGVGEQRVRLHTGMHATAYGLTGSDTASNTTGLPPSLPRMANMSADAIETFRRSVAALVATESSSGTDWRTLTDLIVTRYGESIPEIHLFISKGDFWSLRKARLALVALILPHYVGSVSLQSNLDTCVDSIIGTTDSLLPTLNDYEFKTLHALLHVQRTICTTLVGLHEAFNAAYARRATLPESEGEKNLLESFDAQLWADRLQDLMQTLDWKVWLRCPTVCAWNEMCHIPIWPLIDYAKRNDTRRPTPKCVDWESSGDA